MRRGVDTAKAEGFRRIRFDTIEDALAEIDRIVAADRAGTLRAIGNWTPGQILAHVAAWIEYGYDGFPLRPPPWFIRWYLRRQLKKYLAGEMPRGVRIPRVEQGTYGMDDMSVAEAAARLLRALERLQRGEPAKYDNPAFGRMTDPDRVRLNLRHAELHLGFLNYEA